MEAELPAPYMRALTNEVKSIQKIIDKAHGMMEQRTEEDKRYYEPTNALIDAIKSARFRFLENVADAAEIIEEETQRIEKIKQANQSALDELMISTNVLADAPIPEDSHPVGLAVRSLASIFPFLVFSLTCALG